MIPSETIRKFLDWESRPPIKVRGLPIEELRAMILHTTGIPWEPKIPWTGNDRDVRQLEAIALALRVRRGLLYYEPRTGKTRIGLDWLQHIQKMGKLRKVLIIPHSPLGVDEWERQIPIFSDLQLVAIRTGPDAYKMLSRVLKDRRSHGVLCTWSTLQSLMTTKRKNRKGKNQMYVDAIRTQHISELLNAVIIDEIHGINNPESLRFKIVQGLIKDLYSDCPWRLGLTGTPFGRNPFGLWSQARLIDSGVSLSKSPRLFTEAFKIPEVVDDKRGKKRRNPKYQGKLEFNHDMMPLLKKRMGHMTLACKLSDIQDINILHQTIPLKMCSEQRSAYSMMIGKFAEAAAEENTDFSLRRKVRNIFVRLRQIASGYLVDVDEAGSRKTTEFSTPKLDWFEDFLDTDYHPGMKPIIFHEFINSGDRICRVLDEKGIRYSRLCGQTVDKAAAKDAFQYGDSPFLVANHATGGVGIDLSASNYMIVYESPVGFISRQQMMARPMARGSTVLAVDDLVCAPVERRILSLHAQGRELNEMFTKPNELADLLRE